MEVPNVRKDAGYPPLVTPSSQIVGTQAVFNVIMGERYKWLPRNLKDCSAVNTVKRRCRLIRNSVSKSSATKNPIDCRPADLLKPELETLKKECAEWIEQDEDVLSYAQFGQVATKFFENRRNKKLGIDADHVDKAGKVHPV